MFKLCVGLIDVLGGPRNIVVGIGCIEDRETHRDETQHFHQSYRALPVKMFRITREDSLSNNRVLRK